MCCVASIGPKEKLKSLLKITWKHIIFIMKFTVAELSPGLIGAVNLPEKYIISFFFLIYYFFLLFLLLYPIYSKLSLNYFKTVSQTEILNFVYSAAVKP